VAADDQRRDPARQGAASGADPVGGHKRDAGGHGQQHERAGGGAAKASLEQALSIWSKR
jgi:hypothetical protein